MIAPCRAALVALAVASSACGGGVGPAAHGAARTSVSAGARRPSLATVERDGDARASVAVAVTTYGIAPERGAVVAVALAALVEERLSARGIADATVVAGWDGWRLRALVESPAAAGGIVDAARDAVLAPVLSGDPAMPAVTRRVGALTRRALPDPALAEVARCTGEAYGLHGDVAPTEAELETWRRAAHGLARVAIATTGDASFADAAAAALARGPAWPAGAPVAPSVGPVAARAAVYDASGELAPGSARIVVTVRTTAPERAVAAASGLGDPRGPLASRLAGLDAPGRVRSVIATAHADGGCVAASIDLSPRDLVSDAAARIATVASLARQELAVEIADAAGPPELGRALAMRAADPRDAAELAAWWRLAGRGSVQDDLRVGLFIGVAAPRDGVASRGAGAVDPAAHAGAKAATLGDAIRAELDRADAAWHVPAVEARARVERGQGEVWVLLGTPCGTLAESVRDAGTGAAMATAAALQATADAGDARVEPFVATDGVGVLAHGAAHGDESPQALARRLADLAARAFAADALDPNRTARARTVLLSRVGEVSERTLAALGGALAPDHPSWVDPLGTSFALGSASDDMLALRAAAVRAGPLRVAVLANTDAAQADGAIRAVDRWVARRPGELRACPPLAAAAAPRAGTYSFELPAGAQSEALLAIPLPAGDSAARAAGRWIAAALDGPSGLLARAVGGMAQGEQARPALATAWSAGLVGVPRSPALVIRLVAGNALLDSAVAQARALLGRVREGALREEDRARASAAIGRAAMNEALQPRARAIALWRGEARGDARGEVLASAPSLEALRAFAATNLRDDALVILAARPPRAELPAQ